MAETRFEQSLRCPPCRAGDRRDALQSLGSSPTQLAIYAQGSHAPGFWPSDHAGIWALLPLRQS